MKGKRCLVTGANSGIGFATAEELARRGAAVVMVCRDKERGEAARAKIAKRVPEASVDLLIADLASQSERSSRAPLWALELTLTIREGADALSRGSSKLVSWK